MRHMDIRYRVRTIGHLGFTFASGLSITYFLTILILILTLENLHDFQGVEPLTLSWLAIHLSAQTITCTY